RSWGNTNRPRSANLVIDRLEFQIVVEDLDPPVAAISHVNVALRVRCNCVRQVELAALRTFGANRRDVPPLLVVLHDPRITVPVGDENVAGGVPCDVGRPVECIRLRWWLGSSRRLYSLDRFGPSAEEHDYSPLGIELDHHVRPLIDGPNIVLRVD